MKETKTNCDFVIESILLKKAAHVLRAINHPLRQQMLRLMHKNQRIAVTALYVKLRLEQSAASQHLAILRKSGFVNARREGKQIFYSVNYSRLAFVTRQASTLTLVQKA